MTTPITNRELINKLNHIRSKMANNRNFADANALSEAMVRLKELDQLTTNLPEEKKNVKPSK